MSKLIEKSPFDDNSSSGSGSRLARYSAARDDECTKLLGGDSEAARSSSGRSFDGGDGGKLPTPTTTGEWLQNLAHVYGHSLLFFLFAARHLHSVANVLSIECSKWVFREYSIPGPHMQVYEGIIGLPNVLKPVLGMVSDLCPIGGYNKGPYIIFATLFGGIGYAVIGFSDVSVKVGVIVACMVLIAFQESVCSLLVTSKVSEHLRDKPEHSPDLLSFLFIGSNLGGLVAVIISGVLVASFSPTSPFIVAIPFALAILWPTMTNAMRETPQSAQAREDVWRSVDQHREAVVLCVLLCLGSLAITFSGMYTDSTRVHFWVAAISFAVILGAFSILLRPEMAKVNAFFALDKALTIGVDGALYYFMTDTATQFPGGPNLSIEFYMIIVGMVWILASIIGIVIYNTYMKDWTYYRIMLVSYCTGGAILPLNIMFLTRINTALGFPDSLLIVFVIFSTGAAMQWPWMAGTQLYAQFCPRGMESMILALMGGCWFFASSVAEFSGAYFLHIFDINPAGKENEGAQFDNLWLVVALGNGTRIGMLLVLPYMLPNVRQTERFFQDENWSATDGSLWKRWNECRDS